MTSVFYRGDQSSAIGVYVMITVVGLVCAESAGVFLLVYEERVRL
ncbi:hypothetical protein AB0323_00885 [Arthrobacter sp. NPDC080031]